MKKSDLRRYEMLVRVRDFGETHQDLFPESTVGAQSFAAVRTAVEQLGGHAVSTLDTARERIKVRQAAREALVEKLGSVVRAAKVVGEATPGWVNTFRLPGKRPDQLLLLIARNFIRDVAAADKQFIAHGMPPTIVADLTGLVDTFERALRSREVGREEKTAAEAGVKAALASGAAAVRRLDVVVEHQLGADPVLTAVWKRDRYIHGTKQSKPAADMEPAAPAVAPPLAPLAIVPPTIAAPVAATPAVSPATTLSPAGETGPAEGADVAERRAS